MKKEQIDLFVNEIDIAELKAKANSLPTIKMSPSLVCDLELLANGSFSPLDKFMNQADFESVLEQMRLANGEVFPLPVTLSIDSIEGIHLDKEIALRDIYHNLLAIMRVEEIYQWSKIDYARKVLGTEDSQHPFIPKINQGGQFNISGQLRVLNIPSPFDFKDLRLTPKQTRSKLKELGNKTVVAFQTRNPLHRVHEEILRKAIDVTNGTLLLHPVVGAKNKTDIDYIPRVKTYQILVDKYLNNKKILLALLPYSMRMAGSREALLHAIIRRNYGATHFIVGRNHASPGIDSNGKQFYESNSAAELVEKYSDEIGITAITFDELVYLPNEKTYKEIKDVTQNTKTISLSGTQVREDYLDKQKPLPEWFTRPEIADILAENHIPKYKQGFCIWFTGLSGAGKSTTAEALTSFLMEINRRVTLLDGDVVRTNLSKGLGFSKEDRDTNILRIGYVASEIVKHNGIVICATISPYNATRNQVRQMVGEENFIEVFVDTSLEECEKRDIKGLYAKARNGKIKNFTGIDDVYEKPKNPEVIIETNNSQVEVNVTKIINFLIEKGFTKSDK